MKYFFVLVMLSMVIAESKMSKAESEARIKILSEAKSKLGTGYDSKNKQGFDCSGFVQHCYSKANIKIPRSSRAQFIQGSASENGDRLPGDIIAFTGKNHRSYHAGHVGIITEIKGDTLFFIHASSSRGVVIDHSFSTYYHKRFLGVLNMASY